VGAATSTHQIHAFDAVVMARVTWVRANVLFLDLTLLYVLKVGVVAQN
jgi:hypothetical protein